MKKPILVGALTVGLLFTGCSGKSDQTKLVVFAASSLTGTFDTLATQFEKDHPGVDVVTSFDSSSTLVEQIVQGADVDVMATADEESMQPLVDKSLTAATPTPFATNHLIVVAPKGNPAGVKSIADLAHTDFVSCDPSAPCGAASAKVLAAANITAKPKSLEDNVKAVLSKVMLGEADAGLVYVTDAQAAGNDVVSIPIPDSLNVTTKDLITAVKGSTQPRLAQEWIGYLKSAAGRQVIASAGFGTP